MLNHIKTESDDRNLLSSMSQSKYLEINFQTLLFSDIFLCNMFNVLLLILTNINVRLYVLTSYYVKYGCTFLWYFWSLKILLMQVCPTYINSFEIPLSLSVFLNPLYFWLICLFICFKLIQLGDFPQNSIAFSSVC